MDTVNRIFELVDRQFKEQRDFAKAIGLPSNVVSNWRCGRSGSYNKNLPVIASTLGVSVEYLLTGEEQKNALPVQTDEESVARQIDSMTPQQLMEVIERASARLRQLI